MVPGWETRRLAHSEGARGMSGRGRGPGGTGRGRYRGGDEVDGLERPLLRATGDDLDDDDRAEFSREAGGEETRVRVIVEDVEDVAVAAAAAADDDEYGSDDSRRGRSPRPDASARLGLSHREAARRLRRLGPNQPPPPNDRRPSRVAAWATWRSPTAVAMWLAIACECARALAHYRTDASDADASDATDPDFFSDYDPGSSTSSGGEFRYGADREPVWAAILALLAVQALHAWCAWARETRAHLAASKGIGTGGIGSGGVVAVRDGEPRRVSALEVVPGDVLRIRAGDVVPADAEVLIPGDGGADSGICPTARLRDRGEGSADGVPRRRSRTRSAEGSSRAASAAASGSRRGRRRSPASASAW